MSFKPWGRPGAGRRFSFRLPFKTRYLLAEIIYGAVLGVIAFFVSLLISEFGVWVSILWMSAVSRIRIYFHIIFWAMNGAFMTIPVYNKRFTQLLTAAAIVICSWLILTRHFSFNPILTFFEVNY